MHRCLRPPYCFYTSTRHVTGPWKCVLICAATVRPPRSSYDLLRYASSLTAYWSLGLLVARLLVASRSTGRRAESACERLLSASVMLLRLCSLQATAHEAAGG